MALVLGALLLAASIPASRAYPYYWVDPLFNLGVGLVPQCDAHPTTARGSHRAPQADSSISFALSPASGSSTAATQTVCPGASYNVRVTWSSGTRNALLTAPFGSTFRSALAASQNTAVYYYSSSQGINCTNRLVTSVEQSSLSDQITVPCNASGTYALRLTSATGQTSAFLTGSTSLTVDSSCATSACPRATGPSPPPAARSPPSPAPTAVAADPPPALSPPPSPVVNVSGGCQPSAYNYSCSAQFGGVTVHYTLRGALPDNACTRGRTLALPQGQSLDNVLHMAVEAQVTGYVALSFAQTAGTMAPADAVLGWSSVNGNQQVNTYRVSDSSSLAASQTNPFALLTGVARVGPSVVVCFTRLLNEPNATVSSTLDPTNLKLNWAISPATAFVTHTSSGGGTLNIVTGAVAQTSSKKDLQIRWHGALMSAGWALLLPLGAMFPAHRWVLRDAKIGSKHVWFYLHVSLQCLGFAVMTAGFAIAYYYLSDPESYAGDIGATHQVLGTIVYGMACLQLLAGFFRPDVNSPIRPWFTHGHRWWGNLTLVASWVTIYLGIKVYHMSIYQENMTPWLAVVSAVLGTIIVTDLVLYLVAWLRPSVKEAGQQQNFSDMHVKADRVDGPANGNKPAEP